MKVNKLSWVMPREIGLIALKGRRSIRATRPVAVSTVATGSSVDLV